MQGRLNGTVQLNSFFKILWSTFFSYWRPAVLFLSVFFFVLCYLFYCLHSVCLVGICRLKCTLVCQQQRFLLIWDPNLLIFWLLFTCFLPAQKSNGHSMVAITAWCPFSLSITWSDILICRKCEEATVIFSSSSILHIVQSNTILMTLWRE